jgi:hypothetical protein
MIKINELPSIEDISMEEVLGTKTLTPEEQIEWDRRKAEYNKLASVKVMFRGVERRRGDFCSFADKPLDDNPELSCSGFTEEENRRAHELAKAYNDKFNNDDDEISSSMFAKWMDKDEFIFRVNDDFTDSCMETVHEKDLEKFLADHGIK